MTLPSRHRIRNLNPGGLRPNTLPLGHGGSHRTHLKHEKTDIYISCYFAQIRMHIGLIVFFRNHTCCEILSMTHRLIKMYCCTVVLLYVHELRRTMSGQKIKTSMQTSSESIPIKSLSWFNVGSALQEVSQR